MKILSFGEIIWDVYPHKKCIGGAPLNFAAHASRAGAESYLLSSVGNDELGREAIDIRPAPAGFPIADGIFMDANTLSQFLLLYSNRQPPMANGSAYKGKRGSFQIFSRFHIYHIKMFRCRIVDTASWHMYIPPISLKNNTRGHTITHKSAFVKPLN